jgi:hypothetical protein
MDCAEGLPRFGESLADAIQGRGWSWLEGAVLAGYMPHIDGTVLALRADFAFYLREIHEYEARGVLGDALHWLEQADVYRDIVAMLEGFIASMEAETARLSIIPECEATPTKIAATWRDDARAANERRGHADARRVQALQDNDAARRQRGRYAHGGL